MWQVYLFFIFIFYFFFIFFFIFFFFFCFCFGCSKYDGIRYSDGAMDYLVKHLKARIVESLLKRLPAEIPHHVGHATLVRVICYDPSSSPLLNSLEFLFAYSWARPAIVEVGKGRGGMFLFLLFLPFHSCSSFFPVSLFHLFYYLFYFLPFSGRRHKMTHKG